MKQREILFRGHSDEYGWRKGSLVIYNNGQCFITDSTKIGRNLIEVNPATVGQFTGLTDKNGKKIWQHDKIKYYQPYAKKWEEGFVLWDDAWASFAIYTNLEDNFAHESDWVKIHDIEIIGNIHDKPQEP